MPAVVVCECTVKVWGWRVAAGWEIKKWGGGGKAMSCESMRELTLDLKFIVRASRDSV